MRTLSLVGSVIRSFADSGTEDIFDGRNTKVARQSCPREIWNVARRKLHLLHYADELGGLAASPGNRLEALTGDRSGQHSVRINDQYRVYFRWTPDGPAAVEITDYH